MSLFEFKIFMFENSENKAQINEKIPSLHQSRYLKNAPTDFSVKLQTVTVRMLFYIRARFRVKNRNRC